MAFRVHSGTSAPQGWFQTRGWLRVSACCSAKGGVECHLSEDMEGIPGELAPTATVIFPSSQRGGCGIDKKSRSHRSAADGVARSASPIGRSLNGRSARCLGLKISAELTPPSAPQPAGCRRRHPSSARRGMPLGVKSCQKTRKQQSCHNRHIIAGQRCFERLP